MKHPSLQTLKNLKFTGLSDERLADYAYALSCCKFPASVNSNEWHRAVASLCERKIHELRIEIDRRLRTKGDVRSVSYALQVCNGTGTYYNSACEYFSIPATGRSKKHGLELFGQLLQPLDSSMQIVEPCRY